MQLYWESSTKQRALDAGRSVENMHTNSTTEDGPKSVSLMVTTQFDNKLCISVYMQHLRNQNTTQQRVLNAPCICTNFNSFSGFLARKCLITAAAQSTHSSKNTVDYLYGAQNELYSSQDKENGKESDIPLHDVLRFLTLRPLIIL